MASDFSFWLQPTLLETSSLAPTEETEKESFLHQDFLVSSALAAQLCHAQSGGEDRGS